ncbi:MAG: hypothetical protein ACO3I0_14170 [Limisphaerales bacterium]|jgi:hypothetical protein
MNSEESSGESPGKPRKRGTSVISIPVLMVSFFLLPSGLEFVFHAAQDLFWDLLREQTVAWVWQSMMP